uniref:Late trypsin n=1 Tax=Melanoplus sanguinipes TaxID=65742 RepID=A0A0U4ARP0_MELSA|nr:late trypsin [Melanoplus sanguinipes]
MATRVLYILASALCVVMARASIAKQGGHKSHTAQEGRIIGGKPATLGQFPHMAAVDDFREFVCGGSLISKRSILTAAHCVEFDGPYRIHLGTIKRETMGPTGWVTITHYAKVHPEFHSPGWLNNDIAIIFLMDEAPVTEYIKPVALPSFDEIGDTFLERNTILSGWEGRVTKEVLPNIFNGLKRLLFPMKCARCSTNLGKLLIVRCVSTTSNLDHAMVTVAAHLLSRLQQVTSRLASSAMDPRIVNSIYHGSTPE